MGLPAPALQPHELGSTILPAALRLPLSTPPSTLHPFPLVHNAISAC